MNNNNDDKNIENIKKYICDLNNYVSEHKEHYLQIFYLYNDNKDKAKKLLSNLFRLIISLYKFTEQKSDKKKIMKLLLDYNNLFSKILKHNKKLSQHQRVDIITIRVYTKILIKLIKNTNVIEIIESSENSICYDNPVDILKCSKKYLDIAVIGLKNIMRLLSMMDVIFSEMGNEYLKKVNCYNLYDPSLMVNENDVEYNNKLLKTSYDQLVSLITNKDYKGNNIFNDNSDTIPIEAFLEDCKTFVLCIIDNIRIRLDTINGFQTIIVDIGSKKYNIQFLKDTLDNGSAIVIMKTNFSALKSIMYSLSLNKKLIVYWLNILKENIKK